MTKQGTENRDLLAEERQRRQIVQYSHKIPPLPDVVTKLMSLIQNGETEPSQIEAVLVHDPVLVGKVLGLVNSALFALNREISSISDAVVMLGFAPLRSLVLAYSAANFMQEDYSCYGYTEKGLWHHSVAVSAACRRLAKVHGMAREEQETMFLSGLLHDVGKVLLVPQLNQRRVNLRSFPGSVSAMENAVAGLDHTEAGALVATVWGLPDSVQEPIKQHHGGSGPADYREQAAILRLANALAHELGMGKLPGQSQEANYRSEDLQALNLQGDAWDSTRNEMIAAVDEAMTSMAKIVA